MGYVLSNSRRVTGVGTDRWAPNLLAWSTARPASSLPVRLRVRLHVYPGKEHAVLGQEVADPKGVRGVARADHPQAGEGGRLVQELPAGDERLKDDFAQVRAQVQHAPQALAGNFDHLAVTPGDGADNSRSAGHVRDVASELAFAMDGEPLRLVPRIIDDLDLARLHNEE